MQPELSDGVFRIASGSVGPLISVSNDLGADRRALEAVTRLRPLPRPGAGTKVELEGGGTAFVVGVGPGSSCITLVLPPRASSAGRADLPDSGLTQRQREVLTLAEARRLSNLEISQELGISVHTVRAHLKAARRKVGATTSRRVDRAPLVRPATCFSPEELQALQAITYSPLVGRLATLLEISPRACRRLLESILYKAGGRNGSRGAREPERTA